MRLRDGRQVKRVASGVVFALLFQPVFQAAGQQLQADLPAQQQVEPVRTQTPQDQLPDSPGAVQSRPAQLLAMRDQDPASSQGATSQSSGTGAQNAANDPKQDSPTPDPNSQAPSNAGTPEAPAASPNDSQPAAQTPPPQTPREPVGTAAAESLATTGVAASRPAGVAVAPAKQKRVRSILIKVGALVGVGVAVGTTVALSQGSPSRPPGSH